MASAGQYFKGKVAWVTGASSGIGRALAEELAELGASVVLSARNEEALKDVARHFSGKHLVLPLDVTDFDAIGQAVQTIRDTFGRLDILINNAGVSQRSSIRETGMDVYRQLMEVNYFAPVALSKAVLRQMKEQGGGDIAVISSAVGKVYTPRRSGYTASKHAVQGWFDSLRCEVWKDHIRVLIVSPGYVKTNLSLNALSEDGSKHGKMDKTQEKGITAEKCAKAVLKAIARGKNELVIGGLQEQFGVLLRRFFPRLYAVVARNLPVS